MVHKATILIVDDIPANIDLVAGILGNRYQLKIATGGEKALQIANSDSPPDLILLDIMMPGMDGLEVCRRLKAMPDTSDIPVIFFSALGGDQDITRGLAIGAVDYVAKPIAPEVLKARVATHLALKAGRDALKREVELQKKHNALQQDVERMTRHDLKNPLGLIMGYAAMFGKDQQLTEDQRESARYIESAAMDMLRLINNSLNLYKIEQGTYPLNAESFDLLAVVRRCMSEQRALVTAQGVSLRLQVPGSLRASGDELLTLSLLGNLLRNAVEASGQGDEVLISCDEGEQVKVSVSNPAPVPLGIRDRFFDRYVTAGKSLGTGIGTYSARLLAEVQNGRIGYETDDTRGTCVWFSLPQAP